MSGRAVTFTVPGKPVPAVRMTRQSKFTSAAAQRYLSYKDAVGWAARNAGCHEPSGEPIDLLVTVWLPSGLKTRGDLDNYVKTVADGLNGVAWYDDRQVVHLEAMIVRGGPMVTVTVKDLPR